MKKAKLSSKTETDFVSLTAHQLKKPLSDIRLSLEMLLKGDFGKITDEQKILVEKILQRNESLICLVKDLLDIAKIEDGAGVEELKPVDMEELVRSVLSFSNGEIERKKIKLNIEKGNMAVPSLMLDKEKIYLAVENIVDNAVEYTPDGGSITIFFKVNSKELELEVRDSGIGVAESEKKNLFTKFFRGKNAVKVNESGSGLGLFIAKKIIESSRGRIWFESKENKGSSFFVSLPLG